VSQLGLEHQDGRNMKAKSRNVGRTALIGLLIAVACAGKNLKHVGDVNDGAGGDDGGLGGKSDGTGGKSGGSGGKAGGLAGQTGIDEPGGAGPIIDEPGGAGPVVDEPGGAGGAGEGEGLVCEGCELMAETPDIRGIWAGANQLYWIEYGGFDELENYLDNGRLMSMPLEGGTSEAVVSDLQGPRQLAMTEDYAYVVVDRSSAVVGGLQLVQIALDTGQETPLGGITPVEYPYGRDWSRRFFAGGGGYAFWFDDGSVFRLVEGGVGQAEPVLTKDDVMRLLADASHLYAQSNNGIEKMDFDGDSLTTLWACNLCGGGGDPLVIAGDYFYGFNGAYVTRLPLTGGSMKNISPLAPSWASYAVVHGDRFVADLGVRLDNGRVWSGIAEGPLTNADAALQLAVAPQWSDDSGRYATWRAWDATATTVYLGYGGRLYRIARQQ
jgi:hypothetical protein